MTTATIMNDNLITQGKGQVFEVSTPISTTLLGDYPIHDDLGQLYKLDEHEILTTIEGLTDIVLYKINGNVYTVNASEYKFEVSPNEQTAFLTMLLTFKVHANSEEDARDTLHEILIDNSNTLLDFDVFDISKEQTYKTDLLLYQLSGLYKATKLN